MPRHRVLLVLIVAIAAGTRLAGQTAPLTVGIFMDFDSTPGATPIRIMQNAVQSLLRPSGVAIDWRLVKENHGDLPFSRVVVLKFRGRCRVEALAPHVNDFGSIGEDRTLASTKLRDGRVLPFGEVACDEVRAALAYLNPDAGRNERQAAMGLALGRVVAHELYHILGRTTAHAANGLAQASQSLRDLISGNLSFRDDDWRVIREGLSSGQHPTFSDPHEADR